MRVAIGPAMAETVAAGVAGAGVVAGAASVIHVSLWDRRYCVEV